MDWKREKEHILGYMPDINTYLAFDTVEEYQSEYRKVTEKEETNGSV